jgi:16S rRNA (guanine966-N2)-methyltransferase
MALKIISGSFRGESLKTPRGRDTRPTLGRHRESMFMILQPALAEAVVLDLFAGSGALGFEALSRGAQHVTFVETAAAACDTIQQNRKKLDVESRSEIIRDNVLNFLKRRVPSSPFDIILMDPPYAGDLYILTLEMIAQSRTRWLAPYGIVVVQSSSRISPPPQPGNLSVYREKKYSDTLISFYGCPDGATLPE